MYDDEARTLNSLRRALRELGVKAAAGMWGPLERAESLSAQAEQIRENTDAAWQRAVQAMVTRGAIDDRVLADLALYGQHRPRDPGGIGVLTRAVRQAYGTLARECAAQAAAAAPAVLAELATVATDAVTVAAAAKVPADAASVADLFESGLSRPVWDSVVAAHGRWDKAHLVYRWMRELGWLGGDLPGESWLRYADPSKMSPPRLDTMVITRGVQAPVIVFTRALATGAGPGLYGIEDGRARYEAWRTVWGAELRDGVQADEARRRALSGGGTLEDLQAQRAAIRERAGAVRETGR